MAMPESVAQAAHSEAEREARRTKAIDMLKGIEIPWASMSVYEYMSLAKQGRLPKF